MADNEPANYKIICVIFEDNGPFLVEIRRDATVGELKDKIKAERESFASFDAKNLTMYLINLPDDDKLVENVKQRLTIEPALRATDELNALFPETPTEDTVHILVQLTDVGK